MEMHGADAWDGEADVIVVGFGAAGASAALEAAEDGATALVLDRFHGGGATAASGAVVYAGGGTPYQKQAGFDDTPEEMYRYLKQGSGRRRLGRHAAPLLRRARAPTSPGWRRPGVPFEASLCPFKTSYPPDQYYLYFSGNEQVSRYEAQAKPAPRGHRAKGPGISGPDAVPRPGAQPARARHRRALPDRSAAPGLLARRAGHRRRRPRARSPAPAGPPCTAGCPRSTPKPPPTRRASPSASRGARADHGAPLHAVPRPGAQGRHPVGRRLRLQFRQSPRVRARSTCAACPSARPGDDGAGIRLGESAGGATGRMDRFSMWRFYVPPEALMQGVLVNPAGEAHLRRRPVWRHAGQLHRARRAATPIWSSTARPIRRPAARCRRVGLLPEAVHADDARHGPQEGADAGRAGGEDRRLAGRACRRRWMPTTPLASSGRARSAGQGAQALRAARRRRRSTPSIARWTRRTACPASS